ncbi:GAF domain-containing protein [Mycolicibacterium stellerae]|uniref:GAF domain-containing protein n=1 Tax=Mycolicibacterium stellerae TaxID=2358193 RepID=UPI0019D00B0C|nr:GAF domain-containing protein [Mycolicibacterium stellerae]
MTSGLPAFDDWLNHRLVERASEAGEDVDIYVARAVAAQMVADQRQADGPLVKEILIHLAESGVFAQTSMPSVSGVLADADRLRSLYATGLLDSPPEEIYDRNTRAAADALDAPIAAMCLVDVDRQFLKSVVGLGDLSVQERQMPLEHSFCQYAVANGKPLVLEDARNDPVFKNHPLVRGGIVATYLGIPLTDHNQNAIGTLCVFDTKPRLWGPGHVQLLSDLAALAADRIFGPEPDPT